MGEWYVSDLMSYTLFPIALTYPSKNWVGRMI